MTTGNRNTLLGAKLHVNRIDTVIKNHELILKNFKETEIT